MTCTNTTNKKGGGGGQVCKQKTRKNRLEAPVTTKKKENQKTTIANTFVHKQQKCMFPFISKLSDLQKKPFTASMITYS